MRISQLLEDSILFENQTKKAFTQMSQLDGIDPKELKNFFKAVRPYDWHVFGKVTTLNYIFNDVIPQKDKHDFFIFYSPRSKILMGLRIIPGKMGLDEMKYHCTLIIPSSKFQEGYLKQGFVNHLLADIKFMVIETLNTKGNDSVIMWQLKEDMYKLKSINSATESYKDQFIDFTMKMHNYLWTNIKRILRKTSPKGYELFVRQIDSQLPINPHNYYIDITNEIWHEVVLEISDEIERGEMQFITATDRKAALDKVVKIYTKRLENVMLNI